MYETFIPYVIGIAYDFVNAHRIKGNICVMKNIIWHCLLSAFNIRHPKFEWELQKSIKKSITKIVIDLGNSRSGEIYINRELRLGVDYGPGINNIHFCYTGFAAVFHTLSYIFLLFLILN